MSIIVKKWIGSNGEILIPLTEETYNDGNMVSTHGTYFFALTEDKSTPLMGNPMGLLLALTYAADQ